ncbi:MAG: PKD domain-containing protein, partial [Odoribacter sp.]
DTVKVDDCNDSLRRSLWTIDPPLSGFVNTDSFPELSFPHGEYRVKAEFWNGCATPGVAEFRVSVDEFIPIPPIANDTLCHLTSALALEALPAGGEWTLAGAEDLLRVENGVTWFDPKRSGEYEMVYSFSNGSCTATNIKKIKVHSLPKVDAGNDLTMCMNHSPKELVGQPDGGWWEGTGVVTPVFTPQAPGGVSMVYHYKDEHRCINQDTAMMTVYSLPDTAFVSRKQYCRGIEAEFIPRSPEKQYIWNYGDLTPLDTVVEQGKHIYESGGFFDVVLVAVSEHGCLDTSAIRKVEVVNDAPPAVFSMSEHVACGPEVEINIGVDAMDYADPNLHFEWDFGNGHRSENLLPENPQKYSGDLWDTTYYIKWRVFNICNETNMQDSVLVGSVPQIGFTFQHKWDCSPLKLRVKNTSTGNGNHYTWYMGDHTAPERGYEPIEHLYQAEKGTTVFQVSLVAENNCGRDSVAKPLTVLAQSVEAFFETPKNHICVGEEICFTNQTTDTARYVSYKFWDFGDEVRDTTWNACHTYRDSGSYSVLLYVDNGCSFDTITDRIQVLPLPQLSIESESVLCDQDTFHFNIRSDQKLQRWRWNFGDGRDTLVRHPKYIFSHSGIYPVTLEVIAENIAHCKVSSRKEVTVNPRPDLFFTPFDTLVCPPWLYLPKVTGEAAVLMWDYGDGSKQT